MISHAHYVTAVLLLLVVFLVALFIHYAPSPRKTRVRRLYPDGYVSDYKRLLNICLGDKAKVDRLIAYELNKSPGISRHDATLRAVQRFETENRSWR